MTANRRRRPRTERRSCGRSTALLACLGCVVQTGTGFIGHVPRAPSIPSAIAPAAVHLRSWPTTTGAAAREGSESKREGRARPGGALGATGGSLSPSAPVASSMQQSSRSPTESLIRLMMLDPPFAASPGRRPTTALNAGADSSSSGGSNGGNVEMASEKPRRRRGPGRKTLEAAARKAAPVTAATTAASYTVAQAASAGRIAAVDAMEREEADREALNALAGEYQEELRASVAAGRGPSVLVSKQGFEPVHQRRPPPAQQQQPRLVEDDEEEEEEEEEEEDDEDDEDEAGEPRAKKKTKEELDREEARQDALAANIQKQGIKVGAFGKERIVYHHDYLVHEDLGFCRFLAPELTPEAKPDEILLQFSDTNLAIPKDQSHLLTRYRAGDAARVPLSVVSDQSTWLRHKIRVQDRVTKQAVNVMDLYAKRARVEREPCKPDGPEMAEFCKGFDHQPTKDQLRCLVEIENDMVWRKIPMDRLLCGDVGFGKTEVALRAMFRMVRHKKQVALLAPTTILAAQHYRTLLKRMPADVNVALLRGGNTLGSRAIKEAIRNETVHVVVGTHSLLSRKVEFPNLGLLVIDEEQKFGVNQKEKLKVLTTGVDVLTLTATPIPRTLHMSLTGIRDLSTIFSPPSNRQNVTTYIMKGTDEIVQRALTREISRGGQVFYVVPRINQIEEAWQQISRCVPDARVAIGHSKVKNLEDVVLQFTLGRGDVLLATSIIENGIDMPNVNSIVVMDSHMFGLSQLYQMRGRVGRSDVAAYTYLLYPPGHQLSNEAKRRLKAMRELSHLGSGFELANRDLEIRGAGNIFGTDQSGDLKDIGYELYMNMLEKAIVSVRGTDIEPVLRCEVDMGFGEELKGSVPGDYMTCSEDERERQVDRLRVCNSFRELVRIAKEWVKEYSEMPVSVRRLFKHTHLNTACRLLGVSSLSLEFLPERDASLAAGAAGESGGESAKGWTGGGSKKPMVEDLEAARESHAAQSLAEPAAATAATAAATGAPGARGVGSETVEAKGPAATPVNGRKAKAEVGTPRQVVQVGVEAAGGGEAAAAGAGAGAGAGSSGGAGGDGKPVKTVPFAVLRGPEVEQERWEILFRQGPMEYSQLEHVSFRGDVDGVAIRCPLGKEGAWLKGDREEWLDHLLSLLLPLVEYVETKQSLQMKSSTRPPPRFVA